mmetsp:Transcript_103621/g.195158  ORF Transcript_103621/g.195158 Transcript_103621/m.195158 type:complete len:221 (+) Transcript_103621:1881-2543(+)
MHQGAQKSITTSLLPAAWIKYCSSCSECNSFTLSECRDSFTSGFSDGLSAELSTGFLTGLRSRDTNALKSASPKVSCIRLKNVASSSSSSSDVFTPQPSGGMFLGHITQAFPTQHAIWLKCSSTSPDFRCLSGLLLSVISTPSAPLSANSTRFGPTSIANELPARKLASAAVTILPSIFNCRSSTSHASDQDIKDASESRLAGANPQPPTGMVFGHITHA